MLSKANLPKYLCIVTVVLLFISITLTASMLSAADAEETAVYKYGSSGDVVKKIQNKLNNLGYSCGTADGIFGWRTLSAVKKFQKDYGLTVDGIVGARTLNALGISDTSSQNSSGSISSSDTNLLERCVYAEARGEPYSGQVAVAAVILNRVRSSKFPNTISGVIYQPYAFSSVADGQINLTPNQTAKNAVKDALAGWDPTNGCLYFYNPATSTSAWIWSLDVYMTIGKHNFAK